MNREKPRFLTNECTKVDPKIYQFYEKYIIHLSKLLNVRVALCEGEGVESIFAPKELSGIIIFFPDPWTKKLRQRHNRMIDQSVCFMLKRLLCLKGFIWFKTDDYTYYELVCHYMKHAGMLECIDRPEATTGDYSSVFETRFKLQGIPKFEKIWFSDCICA